MNNNQGNRPQRPPMNDEQRRAYEARKKAYYERKRAEEARRRAARKKKITLSMIFVITLLVVFGVAAIIVSISLSSADPKTPTRYTFNIDGDKTRVAYYDANRDGVLCIDMMSLKSILDLTDSNTPGGHNSITFTSRKTGSSVVFTNGSRFAQVNNQNVDMKVAALIKDNTCSVPLSFVAHCFGGITVEVGISTIYIESNSKTHEIFAKSNDTLDMIIKFQTDLSAYEQYINPVGENRDAFLLLVNKEKPLGNAYIPENLVTIDSKYCHNENANQINSYAAKALEAMLIELWAQTGDKGIVGTSGYRSYARQEVLFEQYIAEERAKNPALSQSQLEELVLTYSAKPGTSEHQSGLCIDLVDLSRGETDKLQNFSHANGINCFTTDTDTFLWLKNNAWKFGFILRYPEGKENVTGYSYESWHFRYVGRYHAQKVYVSGLTFEEYLNQNGY